MPTTIVAITGMTCGQCVKHVDAAVRTVPGVDDVHVDLAAGRAVVTHGADVALAALHAAVVDAGYEVTPA